MGTGAILPLGSLIVATAKKITLTENASTTTTISNVSPVWTPPQYSKPALTILTVPASGNPVLVNPSVAGVSAPIYRGGTPPIDYVFDAVLKLMHQRTLTKTRHPVLTGASISDHAYIEPSRVVLEIAMSDAMASFVAGSWVGASTKSISAWQVLKNLQLNKTLLTLSTRLDTYYNMLITSATAPEDNKTLYGLRATITLEEVISASVSSAMAVSSRPQTTGSSSGGTVQSVSPDPAQIQQNTIPSTLWPNVKTFPSVPGASNVSSNSLGQSASKP